jgi:hypothetical protein
MELVDVIRTVGEKGEVRAICLLRRCTIEG